jgi:hypothetical protein
MRKSDVFDNFVKIAQEKGMISMESDQTKKKLEKTHRADSLDISAIETLYGVKPDLPKDMEYEDNIMEDAHPNSVVISPSYDKLNGLVENNIERQNIMLHIVNKSPDGLLTQRKYAESNLLLSLVRVANDLDNKNQEDLRVLADVCLVQASKKKILKTANPLVIPVLIAAAVVLGLVYLKEQTGFLKTGFTQTYNDLIGEIDDLINANESMQTAVGAGHEYKPAFIAEMQQFKSQLQHYNALYQKIEQYIDALDHPGTASELQQVAMRPETNNIINAYNAFKAASIELYPKFKQVQTNFSNEGYKQRQIASTGYAMQALDATKIFHGGKGLVSDDFDDVKRALTPFMQATKNVVTALSASEVKQQQIKDSVQQTNYEAESYYGDAASQPTDTEVPPASKTTDVSYKGDQATSPADVGTLTGDWQDEDLKDVEKEFDF